MSEPKRILFISQQIFPFLSEENDVRMLNRKLPEYFQARGYETRTFMPKFGEINERRNQLHEVIRLSGMNFIISDSDHPLLLKVASLQAARIQVYFIDNDDYFRRRKGIADENGVEYPDNDERCIFFARGVLETIKKVRWTPDIVVCSGWMSALVPLYIKKAYVDTPFFANSKVLMMLDDSEFQTPFSSTFSRKTIIDGIRSNDLRSIDGMSLGYEDLMRFALDYSDAVMLASTQVCPRLLNYAENRGLPIMPFSAVDDYASYKAFCDGLLEIGNE